MRNCKRVLFGARMLVVFSSGGLVGIAWWTAPIPLPRGVSQEHFHRVHASMTREDLLKVLADPDCEEVLPTGEVALFWYSVNNVISVTVDPNSSRVTTGALFSRDDESQMETLQPQG
jgi:hypothetical protein